MGDQYMRFLYDQLIVGAIKYLDEYIKSGKGSLDELKARFREFITEEERRRVKNVEQLLDVLDSKGVIRVDDVKYLKIVAQKLGLKELVDQVEEFETESSAFIWKVFKGGVQTSVIPLKAVLSVKGVVLIALGGTTLYAMYRRDSKLLEDLETFLEMGTKLVAVVRGSVIFVLKISSTSSMKQLWQSYKDGSLKKSLKKALNKIKELKQLSNGEEIDVEVTIDEDKYREVYWNLILSEEKANNLEKENATKDAGRQRRHSICCTRDVPKDRSKQMGMTQVQIRVGRHVTELDEVISNLKGVEEKLLEGGSEVPKTIELEKKRLIEIRRELSEMKIFLAVSGFSEIRVEEAERSLEASQSSQDVMQSPQEIGKIVKNLTDPKRSFLEVRKKVPPGLTNKFHIITKNTEGEVCPTRIESIDVKIKDVKGKEVEKEVFEEQPGRYCVSYKAEESGEYEIQVNIGGEAIKNSPQNIKILDVHELFEPRGTIEFKLPESGEGKLNYPRSISVSDNGEMAIDDHKNHRIQIFSLDGKYLRQFGSQGTGEGQLYYPLGVVFNEDRIIVGDNPDKKGRIQEFDLNGTYVRTVYRHKLWLCGMCVNDDKNIAVCCGGNKERGIKSSIKVFGKQVDPIHQFGIPGDSQQPKSITCSNGKYFVSDFDQHCVYVFDTNGVYLNKFGEKGESDGQFNHPSGLAVYGPDMILVCDSNNHRVQIVTQDGQFIRSFGSYGSDYGQMNWPADVVVTADGRVFVVEFSGNRVSIWL